MSSFDRLLHLRISESSPLLWIIVLGIPFSLFIYAIGSFLKKIGGRPGQGLKKLPVGILLLWLAEIISSILTAFWKLPPAKRPPLGEILLRALNPFLIMGVFFNPFALLIWFLLIGIVVVLFRKSIDSKNP